MTIFGKDQADDADNSARVRGQPYAKFIENLHARLRPRTYFEIGTLAGDTLKLANCASIAVDPHFRITSDVLGQKPSCMFFQEESDAFFRHKDPKAIFGQEIDLAFLDGMHLFEFLLRDFMNTEKHCRPNSVIILHDCLPPGFYMTVRSPADPVREKSRFKNWWCGDVWKVIPVLQKYRPDLRITVTDCVPTGLVLITNLDPKSTELDRRYSEIVSSYSKPNIDRLEYDEFWETVKVTPASKLSDYGEVFTTSECTSSLVVSITDEQSLQATVVESGEHIPADAFQPWLLPRLIGEPPKPSLMGADGLLRAPTVVFGESNVYHLPVYGAIVSSAGRVFKSTISEASFAHPKLNMLPCFEGEGPVTFSPPAESPKLDEAGIFFAYGGHHNYGHFVFDCLPGLVALRTANIVQTLICPPVERWHREFLGYLGYPVLEVTAPVIRIERAVWPNCIDHYLHKPNKILLETRDAILSGCPSASGPRRVYLSRSKIDNRNMINETELEAALAARGFAVVHPQDLGVKDQINTVRDADVIVGPSGAQMANCLFAKPGARIVEIQPTNFTGIWIRNMAHLAGLDWHCLFCTSPITSRQRYLGGRMLDNLLFDWKVNVSAVLDAALAHKPF